MLKLLLRCGSVLGSTLAVVTSEYSEKHIPPFNSVMVLGIMEQLLKVFYSWHGKVVSYLPSQL